MEVIQANDAASPDAASPDATSPDAAPAADGVEGGSHSTNANVDDEMVASYNAALKQYENDQDAAEAESTVAASGAAGSVPLIEAKMGDIELQNRFTHMLFDGHVLYVTFKTMQSAPTDDEWNETILHLKTFYSAALKSKKRFSMVYDLANIYPLPLARCRQWANMFDGMKDDTRACIVCTAILCQNFLFRKVINLFFSMYSAVRPLSFVASLDEAIEYVEQQLKLM